MQSEVVKPKTMFGEKIRFTPYAWAKMLYMRDRGNTEVAGYGVTGTEDPLLVTDFRLIKSECTVASFDMDPDDSVEFMETMLDAGLMPWQYSNILIHTHPGDSPRPSGTDEKNFVKAFSHPHWAIMFIIADGGECYCRVKINVGPGAIREIKVDVDWKHPFSGTDTQKWEDEYQAKVVELKFHMTGKEGAASKFSGCFPDEEMRGVGDPTDPAWYLEEENRWGTLKEAQMTELSRYGDIPTECFEEIDCFWREDGDVAYWVEEGEEGNGAWFYYNPIKRVWHKDDPSDDSKTVEVIPPNEHWVTQIVLWAYKYADERSLSLEESV